MKSHMDKTKRRHPREDGREAKISRKWMKLKIFLIVLYKIIGNKQQQWNLWIRVFWMQLLKKTTWSDYALWKKDFPILNNRNNCSDLFEQLMFENQVFFTALLGADENFFQILKNVSITLLLITY